MSGDSGTCSFCGFGDGHLGETGDETTQYMHSAVRTGEQPWSYEPHPNAWGGHSQSVTWCGNCVGGLAHKFQRYDDVNLRAAHVAGKVRMELDGIRWVHWDTASDRDENAAVKKHHPQDDPAVHMEKLNLARDLDDMQNEELRRAGFDLATNGWRP